MKQFSKTHLPLLGLGRTAKVWPWLLLLTAFYALAAGTLYLTSGLGEWSPRSEPWGRLLLLSAGFFFLPSLAEELLWRWILIPTSCLGRFEPRSLAYIVATSVMFTAAHPLAAYLFVPHARQLFLQPTFLVIVFNLGLTCGTAYVLSKSIWPPVVIHWITVLAWKFLLGGPFVLLGR